MAKRVAKLVVLVDVDEGTTDQEASQMVERAIKQQFGWGHNPLAGVYSQAGFRDVLTFQRKFGIPMAEEPSLLDPVAFDFRRKFMQEELDEVVEAHAEGDMRKVARELMDLAWVTYGTALMMGVPWTMGWHELTRANMEKVRVTDPSQSKRGSSIDIAKPPGWKAPNFTPFMGEGPWPVFQTGAETKKAPADAELEAFVSGEPHCTGHVDYDPASRLPDPGLALRHPED
jgi:predicted HAD superfamily Cof-like phosphohydrolase